MKYALTLRRVAMMIAALTLVGLVVEDASARGWRRRCCRTTYTNNCCYQNVNYCGNVNSCGCGGHYGGHYNNGSYSSGYMSGGNNACCGSGYGSHAATVSPYVKAQPASQATASASQTDSRGRRADSSVTDGERDNPSPTQLNSASRLDRDRDERRQN